MRTLAWTLVFVAVPLAAHADDSSAALGAGGLELTKSAEVRMSAEDLAISPDAVRIRYEFRNDSNKDVDTLVAFPLPDIDAYEFWGTPIGKITADPVNFVGFKVSADGKPIAFKTEQKAMHAGRDVTALVKSAGLPVNVVSGQNYQRFDKLTPAQRKILKTADIAEFDGNQGIAKWIVQTRFYWMQHFPAHKTVVIEHSYKPVTGQAFFSEYDLKAAPGSKDDYWKKKYCMDAGTVAKLRGMLAAHKSENMLNASSTQFILKTANNWQGGIGKFHLTIDKLKPGNVLSLCWDGALKKANPTTFEFTAADFHPPRDLSFVVIGAP
jgi:hypothetical protein